MNNSLTTDDLILYIFIIVIAFIAVKTIAMWIKLQSKKKITQKQNIVGTTNENNSILKKFDEQKETSKREEFKEYISTNTVVHSDNNFQPTANETSYPTVPPTSHSFQNNFDNQNLFENPTNKQFETAMSEIFFMAKPVENYFPISAKSNSPIDTVYKFKFDTNSSIATYEVHTLGAPVSEIIKRSETYLMAGCVEDNISTEHTKGITTLTPGTVKLENNKWIITNKALIRYE